jgi:hypothetical protein
MLTGAPGKICQRLRSRPFGELLRQVAIPLTAFPFITSPIVQLDEHELYIKRLRRRACPDRSILQRLAVNIRPLNAFPPRYTFSSCSMGPGGLP